MGWLRNYFDILGQDSVNFYKATKYYIHDKRMGRRDVKYGLDEPPWTLISFVVAIIILVIVIILL